MGQRDPRAVSWGMWHDDPIPALKEQLARELVRVIGDSNAAAAGALMGADHWRVADLRAGRLHRMSLETLIRYVTRLRRHVTLTVGPPPPRPLRR
jgi:Helix-turn-helix domain